MNISNVKRLGNEMLALEEESNRKIPGDKYYVISVTITGSNITKEQLRDVGKDLLSRNKNHLPLITYVYDNEILLLYSCVDDKHYLNGSHTALCSRYCSLFYDLIYNRFGFILQFIECKIIEFENQTEIFVYFVWKVYTNCYKYMIQISSNKITQRDINFYTAQELYDLLKKYNNIEWDNIPNVDKYGIFFKYNERNGRLHINSISEMMSACDMKRYMDFFFIS